MFSASCRNDYIFECDAGQSSGNLAKFQENRPASIFITVENILKEEAARSFKESAISTRMHRVTSQRTVPFSPVIFLSYYH